MVVATAPAGAAGPAGASCGTTRSGVERALWEHRAQEERRGPARTLGALGADEDVGQIAVLTDEGDLVLLRHPLDLQGAGLEFVPRASGFAVTRVDRPVAADPGGPLALTDDSNVAVALPFSFPFYGKNYTRTFVNSDGNLSFGAGESASTPRDMGRLLAGPPRIAPLFADLDPGAGGGVASFGDAGRFSVTWTGVPQYGESDTSTFQVTLYPDGRIVFAYDDALTSSLAEGVVGVAPGAGFGGLTPVDLSAAAGATGTGALAESFRSQSELDAVAVARKFYATHSDDYQGLVIFTSAKLGRAGGYFAYELTVKNTDAGIGDAIEDYSARFGSAGRLESFVTMDYIFKYPDDPQKVFLGSDTTLSLMGQEVGHRWGAYALFKDGDTVSHELLGRDEQHWSFYLDTDASHLEGNDIEDQGGGSFRTVGSTLRYSPLDQYLMGLRPPGEVPPFFFVRSAPGTPSFDRAAAPETGVSFTGVRKDVTIADVVAALGPRSPAPGPRPPYRQAFVYVDAGGADAAKAVAKVETIRAAWEPFFSRSTDGRGAVDARLH